MKGFFSQTDEVANELDLILNALHVVYEAAFGCRLDIPDHMQKLDSVFVMALQRLKGAQESLDKLTESLTEYERVIAKLSTL